MLCVIKTKGCKRCGGDLSLECDIYGVYAECIQCGANWSEAEIRALLPRPAAAAPKTAAPRTIAATRRRR